jgi:hypothetical protein
MATNEEVLEALQGLTSALDAGLTRIDSTLQQQSAQILEIARQYSEIRTFLYGNGEPGLVGRVREIENRWAYVSKMAGWAGGILASVVVAAMLAISSLIYTALQKVGVFVP